MIGCGVLHFAVGCVSVALVLFFSALYHNLFLGPIVPHLLEVLQLHLVLVLVVEVHFLVLFRSDHCHSIWDQLCGRVVIHTCKSRAAVAGIILHYSHCRAHMLWNVQLHLDHQDSQPSHDQLPNGVGVIAVILVQKCTMAALLLISLKIPS